MLDFDKASPIETTKEDVDSKLLLAFLGNNRYFPRPCTEKDDSVMGRVLQNISQSQRTDTHPEGDIEECDETAGKISPESSRESQGKCQIQSRRHDYFWLRSIANQELHFIFHHVPAKLRFQLPHLAACAFFSNSNACVSCNTH